MRTNIVIDDDLMQEAMALSNLTTKKAVVETGLKLLVQIKKQERLLRVGYPIISSATPLCDEHVKASIGVWFANKYVFPKDYIEAASSKFKLDEGLKVLYIIPNSPADTAGLQLGDVLISINGDEAPKGKNAVEKLQKQLKDQLTVDNVNTFSISRTGNIFSTSLTPIEVCDYPIVLDESDAVNAYADGSKIAITKGMLRFAENDQELALVISHELAHNAMGHIKAKMGNYALGSIVDIIAAAYGVNTQSTFGKMAAKAYSQEFEAEADYVGLYMMAMSGLEIDNAANFWRRMAAEHPGSIKSDYGSSHPSTPERFIGFYLW